MSKPKYYHMDALWANEMIPRYIAPLPFYIVRGGKLTMENKKNGDEKNGRL